jgi:hypothetical protein
MQMQYPFLIPYSTSFKSPRASCNPTVSVVENEPNNYDIKIFPNPATSTLNISFPENMKQQIQIFNSMGMLLKEISVTQQTQIDISDLPKGLYFVHLKNNSAQAEKFIKQ